MTGVSYTIPVVVAGGLAIALSFMFGIDAAKEPGSLAGALMQIGSQAAFALIAPVLSGFIAFSIADRPGLAPGLIGGMLANQIGAGFLGGLASGFLAGYILLSPKLDQAAAEPGMAEARPDHSPARQRRGRVADDLRGRNPDRAILSALTGWLSGMTSANAVLLAAAGHDGGGHGRSGQQAYTFAVAGVGLPADGAVMAAG